MTSRVGRQAFSTTVRAARSARSNVHPPRRFMSADTAAHHDFKPKSDLPWIIGAVAVTVPAVSCFAECFGGGELSRVLKASVFAEGHHGYEDSCRPPWA
ncbi:hypothetical protein B0H17DRAFT_1054115, partial [Mycena rosella]